MLAQAEVGQRLGAWTKERSRSSLVNKYFVLIGQWGKQFSKSFMRQ